MVLANFQFPSEENPNSGVETPSEEHSIADGFDSPYANRDGALRLALALLAPSGGNLISRMCKLWLDCGENLSSD